MNIKTGEKKRITAGGIYGTQGYCYNIKRTGERSEKIQ